MFRSDNHEGGAENRIRARSKYFKLFAVPFNIKESLGASAASNPVALLGFQPVGIIHRIKACEQAFGVGCNAEFPLRHCLLHHGVVATLGATIFNFIIGQHRAEGFAPVHGAIAAVGHAVIHQHVALFLRRHCVISFSREIERFRFGGGEIAGAVGG